MWDYYISVLLYLLYWWPCRWCQWDDSKTAIRLFPPAALNNWSIQEVWVNIYKYSTASQSCNNLSYLSACVSVLYCIERSILLLLKDWLAEALFQIFYMLGRTCCLWLFWGWNMLMWDTTEPFVPQLSGQSDPFTVPRCSAVGPSLSLIQTDMSSQKRES